MDFYSKSGCLLCDEVRNDSPLSVRLGRCVQPNENVLLESDNFQLVPDISPLLPGHSLLITKAHYTSFTIAPARFRDEMRAFAKHCIELVSYEFAVPTLFEHGSSPIRPGSGACVHHAHIHLLPGRAPLTDWMGEFGDVREVPDDLPWNFHGSAAGLDYLACRSQEGRAAVVSALDGTPPCQFIRRKMAEHLRLPDWNWKVEMLRRYAKEVDAGFEFPTHANDKRQADVLQLCN